MTLSDTSLRRPLFTTMLNIFILVVGLLSFQKLGVDQMPNVDLPYVFVTVAYPGANPHTVEEQLLNPLERELRSLEGLKMMTGTASSFGASIQLEFELRVKSEQALSDVKDILGQFILPTGAKAPIVQKINMNQQSVLTLAVNADDIPVAQLMRFVEDNLKPKLQQAQGVGSIEVSGYRESEVHVKLNPSVLNAVSLTPAAVSEQIIRQTLSEPAGTLNQATHMTSMTTYSIPHSLVQVENLPLVTQNGSLMRLGDLAHVSLGLSNQTSYGEFNGKPLIVIRVFKQSGGNLVQIAKQINGKIDEIKKTLPANIHVNVIDENYSFIDNSLKAVGEDIVLGAVLAVLVVFVFLHDWRSTLISAVAIPTSLIGTFIMMRLFNFTLNWMTLLALTISIGILVDDAIVVIENIHRHFKINKDPYRAAQEGTREISLAALAVTLTIVAVFVPVAFMQGIVGRFFLQFGLTVTVAVLISLFVAFTMVPMLSSKMLISQEKTKHNLFISFDNWFYKLQIFYERILKKCLTLRKTTVVVAVVIFIVSLGLMKFVSITMEPAFDDGNVQINVTLEEGLPLLKSIERSQEMQQFIKKFPGVKDIVMTVGAGIGASASSVTYKIQLINEKNRTFTKDEFSALLSQELKGFLKADKEKINFGWNSKPIQIALFSNNDKLLKEYSAQLAQYMNTLSEVHNASSDLSPSFEYRIEPDVLKAAQAKVSPSDLANTLRILFSEDAFVGKYDNAGNLENIRLMIDHPSDQNLNNLLGVTLLQTHEAPVLLSSVANIKKVPLEQSITHIDGLKQLSVQADYTGKDLSGITTKIYDYVAKTHPLDVSYKLLGSSSELNDTIKQVFMVLCLASLFVFMVLCSQFENLVAPLSILMSIPLCFSGAFLALLVTRQPLTLYSMIGVALLMGLVVKNAILLIEFAQQKITAGAGVYEAILEASQTRLRPILMTTLTMIVGMMPMVVSSGAGHEARTNMAVTVIGGLISSTLLTLVVVPCVYSLLVGVRQRIQKRR